MANKHRGEVALGDYTLSFSVNAICDLESALGESVTAIAARLSDPAGVSVSTLRSLLWAGLQDNHSVSLKEAGKIMTDAGIAEAAEKVGEAFTLAFPADEGAGGNGQ